MTALHRLFKLARIIVTGREMEFWAAADQRSSAPRRQAMVSVMVLVAAGIAIGLPAALVATRLIAATLVGLGAYDPATLATATFVMLVVAVMAGWVPARRAARIDPMLALRQE